MIKTQLSAAVASIEIRKGEDAFQKLQAQFGRQMDAAGIDAKIKLAETSDKAGGTREGLRQEINLPDRKITVFIDYSPQAGTPRLTRPVAVSQEASALKERGQEAFKQAYQAALYNGQPRVESLARAIYRLTLHKIGYEPELFEAHGYNLDTFYRGLGFERAILRYLETGKMPADFWRVMESHVPAKGFSATNGPTILRAIETNIAEAAVNTAGSVYQGRDAAEAIASFQRDIASAAQAHQPEAEKRQRQTRQEIIKRRAEANKRKALRARR